MYLRDATLEQISERTGVSVTTLVKWKKDGDWERQRSERRKNPMAMAEKVAAALEMKVDSMTDIVRGGGDPPNELCDAISKLAAVFKSLNQVEDPARSVIYVTDLLAQFVRKTVEDEALAGQLCQVLDNFYRDFKETHG